MRYFISVLLVLCWFFMVIVWPKSANPPMDQTPEEKRASLGEHLYRSSITDAHFGLLGASLYETSKGKKHWKLKSSFTELHREQNYAFMKEVTANFYSDKTDNVMVATSDFGRSWMDQDLIQLEGNVIIESRKGYLFTMDKLDYRGKTHDFFTTNLVNMKGPDPKRPTMFIKGTGLLANLDQEYFTLKRRVSAKRRLLNSQWLHVTSGSGEFFVDEQKAIFRSNVRSNLPKVDITSDYFELNVSEGKEIVSASGNVILVNRDRIGKAENAYIEVGESEIILAGKAQINTNKNVITGKRIVISTEDDRLEVEQAEGKVLH